MARQKRLRQLRVYERLFKGRWSSFLLGGSLDNLRFQGTGDQHEAKPLVGRSIVNKFGKNPYQFEPNYDHSIDYIVYDTTHKPGFHQGIGRFKNRVGEMHTLIKKNKAGKADLDFYVQYWEEIKDSKHHDTGDRDHTGDISVMYSHEFLKDDERSQAESRELSQLIDIELNLKSLAQDAGRAGDDQGAKVQYLMRQINRSKVDIWFNWGDYYHLQDVDLDVIVDKNWTKSILPKANHYDIKDREGTVMATVHRNLWRLLSFRNEYVIDIYDDRLDTPRGHKLLSLLTLYLHNAPAIKRSRFSRPEATPSLEPVAAESASE